MSNTRFCFQNYLINDPLASPIIKNGTGGGAPALFENATYPTSNLLIEDRYTIFKSTLLTFGNVYDLDIDMGASRTLDTYALLGWRIIAGSYPTFDIYTQTGTYTPAGTWNFRGNFPMDTTSRDFFFSGASFGSLRTVRFEITPSVTNCQFTLGKVYAGQKVDFGNIYSPGSTKSSMKNRSEITLPNGTVFMNQMGDDGAEHNLRWRSASGTIRTNLLNARARAGSFVYLDSEDNVQEVFLQEGRVTEAKGFSNSWDLDVTLRQLP